MMLVRSDPGGVGVADGMQEEDRAQRLCSREQLLVALVRDFDAGDVRPELHAAEAELVHAVFELSDCEPRVLHRRGAKGHETVGI
jgi:hypothetical protein